MIEKIIALYEYADLLHEKGYEYSAEKLNKLISSILIDIKRVDRIIHKEDWYE
jgi:hypothetical protein